MISRKPLFVRLVIDEIAAGRTTKMGLFNNRDKVYFTVAGSSAQGQIEIPRVSPAPLPDYYGFKAGRKARNIQLWEGYLDNAEDACLTVVICEQDRDQPLGAFAVRVHHQDLNLVAEWAAISPTVMAVQNGPTAVFEASGSKARYTVRASVQPLPLPMIVNKNSGKCLEVVDGSIAEQANVQQNPIEGRGNQRWFFKFLGVAPAFPVTFLPFPYYAIMADQSGQCLDVVDGSMADQVNVQLDPPRYDANQSWIFVPTREDFILINLHSRKVLDVAGGNTEAHAQIQQFRYHDGLNQRWSLQY